MEDLIGLALDAFAKKTQPAGRSPDQEAINERYQRILADLRARAASLEPARTAPEPPLSVRPVAQPQRPAEQPPPPSPPPAAVPSHGHRHALQGLFEGGNSLMRAVVAAELLDRPLALRESAPWQRG